MVIKNRIILAALILNSLLLASCENAGAIADTNQAINSGNWSYINRVNTSVKIDDVTSSYNIYINLRHTGDYKYSNIFMKIHIRNPDGKVTTERKEFKLALADGQWLGKGTGNMYSYQLPFKENLRFTKTGNYKFEIEQNMRDNPLKEVTDVGLRIEKIN